FMYDPSGLLKKPGLPVFECNSLCGCGEECRNRVVSKGRKCNVMLKKTDKKGWGVFACEHIPKGTFIGIYSGELLGHEESEERAIKYDQFGRTYLFDIDWWYIDAELDAKEAKEKQQKHKETLKTTEEEESALHEQIPIDNHSCDPNAALTPVYIDVDEIERPLLTIFSKRHIHPHEEITFSYSGD
ncbi:SET domain-containing protein, partial [Lentinula novae-zelandiae]